VVLYEVIPGVPFPHGLTAHFADWLDFIQRIDEHIALPGQLHLDPGRDCFLRGLSFPDDHHHVAAGHRANGVVAALGLAV